MSAQSFTPGAAMFIAHQSVVRTTGSGEPAVPTRELSDYNVNTGQQLQAISNRIRNNTEIGLPAFGRGIDPNVLRDIATDTTLQDLADIVFFESFAVGPQPSAAPRARAAAAVERPAPGPLAAFVEENPMPALMMAAAAGMLVGFLLGSAARR